MPALRTIASAIPVKICLSATVASQARIAMISTPAQMMSAPLIFASIMPLRIAAHLQPNAMTEITAPRIAVFQTCANMPIHVNAPTMASATIAMCARTTFASAIRAKTTQFQTVAPPQPNAMTEITAPRIAVLATCVKIHLLVNAPTTLNVMMEISVMAAKPARAILVLRADPRPAMILTLVPQIAARVIPASMRTVRLMVYVAIGGLGVPARLPVARELKPGQGAVLAHFVEGTVAGHVKKPKPATMGHALFVEMESLIRVNNATLPALVAQAVARMSRR